MTSPGSSSHLAPLVLQSQKALEQGEQLCQQASFLSTSTSQSSLDVLALDAQVRWMSDAVLDQLEAARTIAISIQDKRSSLAAQIQEWDTLRTKHTGDLENILNSLSSQSVPPSFHQPLADEDEPSPFVIATTVKSTDRNTWKNLRDFVDDNAIDNMLETIENERLSLEDTFVTTDGYDATLNRTIEMIRASVERNSRPSAREVVKIIESTLSRQDILKTVMADHLESLARHYEQMAEALKEAESGDDFGEEDINDMNRDTEELPSIVAELEESLRIIEETHDILINQRNTLNASIEGMKSTIDDLDELGEIMGDMLSAQDRIQNQCQTQLITLHSHLATLASLYDSYAAYQLSYSKLVLELARRKAYTDAAEGIVRGISEQLTAMALEETTMRARFTEDYGSNIPEDICLSIGDMPTKWIILPDSNGRRLKDSLPDIPADVLTEAKSLIGRAEMDGSVPPGMDSL